MPIACQVCVLKMYFYFFYYESDFLYFILSYLIFGLTISVTSTEWYLLITLLTRCKTHTFCFFFSNLSWVLHITARWVAMIFTSALWYPYICAYRWRSNNFFLRVRCTSRSFSARTGNIFIIGTFGFSSWNFCNWLLFNIGRICNFYKNLSDSCQFHLTPVPHQKLFFLLQEGFLFWLFLVFPLPPYL